MKKSKILIVLFIFLISILLFTNIYLLFLQPLATGKDIPETYGDVILVLGGGLKKGNRIGNSTEERLDLAIKLYREKRRKIIVSDGSLYRRSPAIKTIRGFLLGMGVRRDDIILEGKSQTTFENLVFTRHLIDQLNLKKIIVCTSPYHQRRTGVMIKYLKMKNYKIIKMDESEIFNPDSLKQKIRNIKLILREYVSLVKFKILKK